MSELSVVGKRLPRVDGIEKVTGQGLFTMDVYPPGMLWGKMLRSPYPHARVLRVDASRARALPGVKAVISLEDVPRVRHAGEGPPLDELTGHDQYIFDERVRFVGDGVAAVAAVSREVAEEALELIEVEYEELPAVFDPEEALREEAPRVHALGNLCEGPFLVERGNVRQGFAEADHVIEETYETSRVQHAFLEPYVCVCSLDRSGKLTVWDSTQSPFTIRGAMSVVLGLPRPKIRFLVRHVGGGFGGKLDAYQLEFVCALLAQKTGRPVRMEYSREEVFACGKSRHPSRIWLKQGFKADGTLVAREGRVIMATGAYASHGPGVIKVCCIMLGSLYRCENVRITGYSVYTNAPIAGAYRGYGNPQATFALESQMDAIAERLGMDPLALRRKNHLGVGEMGPLGLPITSCGLPECLERGAQRIGWEAARARNSASRSPSTPWSPRPAGFGLPSVPPNPARFRRGVGLACMIHCSAGVPFIKEQSSAFVKLNEDGTVTLIVGTTDLGTGSNTTLVQIVAEELGVRFEDVHLSGGDTDLTPLDLGSYGSRVAYVAGNAVQRAAADARGQLLRRAASMMEADPEELEVRQGTVRVKGAPHRWVTVSEVAMHALSTFPVEVILGKASFEPSQAPPFAAQFAEVEVDTETGQVRVLRLVAVHDVGLALNPTIVEGQIEGALHHGIGYALTERMAVEDGVVLNPSLADYKLLTALDMPSVEALFVESLDPTGPFGAKGVGEPGLVATAPAIANAIYHAVGVRIRSLPITPEKVLRALKGLPEKTG
ncbi:MAG: molybdopterin-dependent oxidoreductase [Candidatus Tectomicrobia bacterium]|uniref:Molybdopterin-dependent oxidoreductase n=1 Tax=Tectimicrobiota bacterium TaxID=2528274 RepID=A0A932G009_UNCTE|nr:molybdopterin-dependent oxidoreductase [Candidatus Tectomicrobia bacterium]